jgi:GNAT superfamily N-acetyltransferase
MEIKIRRPAFNEIEQIVAVFRESFSVAMKLEGVPEKQILKEADEEAESLRECLQKDFASAGAETFFLVAIAENTIVGLCGLKPPDHLITDNYSIKNGIPEVGFMYILPGFQTNGIGKRLLKGILEELQRKQVNEFCLDSGFKVAQKIWQHLLGEPVAVAKDYWGKGSHHMIWQKQVAEVLKMQ